MALSYAESYRKSLAKINNLFAVLVPRCGREQAATLVLWLSTPGCGAEPHGVPTLASAQSAERTTTPDNILSNIRGILPHELCVELGRWDEWKKRAIAALLATKRGSSITQDRKKFNPARLASRINLCGSSILMLRSTEFENSTLAIPARCNSVACPHCARLISQERAMSVLEVLQNHKNPQNLRMMTLTVQNCPRNGLKNAVSALHGAFKTFRDTKGRAHWKRYVDGYIWNLEVSFNHKNSSWHPHIHLIYDGKFWPEKELKQAWVCAQRAHGFQASEKYPGVWLERLYFKDSTGRKRPVETQDELYGAAREVSKYNLKPLEAGQMKHADTVELLEALFNVRRFGACGTLEIDLEKKRESAIRKEMGITFWELLGGFDQGEKEGWSDDDPEYYARTLTQLERNQAACAAVLRKNQKLSFIAEASCKTKSTKP